MLRIQIASSETGIHVTLSGDLDVVGAVGFRACVEELLRTHGPGHVDVDLADVGFIDCSGSRMLVWADARVRGRGGQMAVVRPSSLVLRLLGLLEFDRHLSIRSAPHVDLNALRVEVNPGLN